MSEELKSKPVVECICKSSLPAVDEVERAFRSNQTEDNEWRTPEDPLLVLPSVSAKENKLWLPVFLLARCQ